MGKRRRARELALQYLYQWDFHGPGQEEPAILFFDNLHDPEEVKAFAASIVLGDKARHEEIDRLIEAQSQHWKLYRMSRVDRNILRIAVFELLDSPDTPPKVSIDEAIEIGKKYGTSDSRAFINGILDQICKRLGRLPGPAPVKSDEDSGDHDPG